MRELKRQFEVASTVFLAAVLLCGGFCVAAYENRTSIKETVKGARLAENTVMAIPLDTVDKPCEVPPTVLPPSAQEPSRYASIDLSDEDVEILARLVWLEARGEPFEGQVAVAEVVFNRILSDRFPGQDDVNTVVFEKNQFTPAPYIWNESTTPGEAQYEAVRAAYAAEKPITDLDVVYFSRAPYNDKLYALIGHHYFCRV